MSAAVSIVTRQLQQSVLANVCSDIHEDDIHLLACWGIYLPGALCKSTQAPAPRTPLHYSTLVRVGITHEPPVGSSTPSTLVRKREVSHSLQFCNTPMATRKTDVTDVALIGASTSIALTLLAASSMRRENWSSK